MSTTRTKLLTLTTAGAVAIGALLPASGALAHETTSSETPRALATARAATAAYHDVETAIADGFLPTEHCVASPWGGMGHHYVNPGRLADGLVISEPEVLLYEKDLSGRMRLVGIEYILIDADQDPTTVEDHAFAGTHFHGPSFNPAAGYHYPLHVWLWKHNPDGMFADWNPNVAC